MELSRFCVSIHSDGEQLKEYSVETSADGKKAACWIPSQSGKVRFFEHRLVKYKTETLQRNLW